MSDRPDPPSHDPDRTRTQDGTAGSERSASREADSLPESIGPYRILGKLGEGGMGVVYEAEQQNPRRRVALKVIRGGGVVDEQFVRMFQREVATLARLEHPNIGAIFESGRTEGGEHFFAMELVRGDTLGTHMAARPSLDRPGELELRLALFRKIADAVHYAHQRGVIHRDIKPSNVIVTSREVSPDDTTASGRIPIVKILDFGLARIVDPEVQSASMVTEVGLIKGTLAYMSPEQSRGEPHEIDVRTDVYALGVLLYEMLTGRRPVETRNRSLVDSLRAISEEAPSPLRQSWPGGRRLDPDVETIVGKALEKDKDRRYASAAMLSEDVGRYLTSQPILARPPTAWYQIRKFAGRNRVLVLGAAATVAALVVGAVTSTVLGLREATQRRAAESARADLQSLVEFQGRILEQVDPQTTGRGISRALSEALAGALDNRGRSAEEVESAVRRLEAAAADANPTDVARTVLHENVLAPAAAAARAEFGSHPAIEARLLETLARSYRSLGLSEQAETHARRSLDLRRRELGAEQPDTLRSAVLLGRVLSERGRHDEADELLGSALATLGRIAGPDHPLALDAASAATILEWRRGRLDRAAAIAADALPRQRRILGEDDPLTLETMNIHAATLVGLGRPSEAEALYGEVLERNRRINGDDHMWTVAAMNNLADVRLGMGRVDDAEALFREAYERYGRILGESHPVTIHVMRNLARVAEHRGRAEEAEQVYRRVIELREGLRGPDHPGTLEALNGLGVFLTAEGRFAESRELLDDLLERAERSLGRDSVAFATYVHSYGELLMAAGELAGAERKLQEALAVYERRGSRYTGLAHQQLGIIAARRGEREAALRSLRSAREGGVPAARLLEDPALEPFRADPEFAALAAPGQGSADGGG